MNNYEFFLFRHTFDKKFYFNVEFDISMNLFQSAKNSLFKREIVNKNTNEWEKLWNLD